MAAVADIFPSDHVSRTSLFGSVALHALLFGLAIFGNLIPSGRGENWGGTQGGGGAMSATLVSSIPLPNAQPESQNVLANESKGLSQSPPKETPKEEPKAIPIPAREAKPKSQRETVASKREPPKPIAKAEPDNVVPYGQGGPVSGPYGSFTSGATKGGFGFQGGQGDFGSRFAYYVDIVRRKVSENWLKYEVDPRISDARRVYIYFEINRSGQPSNIRVEQSSGIPSLDQSAVRALQRIDTFGPLPAGYNGSYVAVEFWFDYRR
ncbi:MAG TPA: TonB family protein [Candidatus Eisenbacteria bacterium]|nr:TonB family protein [Candidatus Eisenbacteria bacterium]